MTTPSTMAITMPNTPAAVPALATHLATRGSFHRISRPMATGTTTSSSERKISKYGTSILPTSSAPPTVAGSVLLNGSVYRYVKSGRPANDASVVADVMMIDSATSPFDKYVYSWLVVPPGEQPHRMMPTATASLNENMYANASDHSGMKTHCEKKPITNGHGPTDGLHSPSSPRQHFVNTTALTSSIDTVAPMPSISSANRIAST
mmetsp:Transcript_36613/g.89437  ORF Transcript_36613/g.89437 Transcript_36613/m.89437 type:complete len:206 (-) Transcript_36613:402-1019(-)